MNCVARLMAERIRCLVCGCRVSEVFRYNWKMMSVVVKRERKRREYCYAIFGQFFSFASSFFPSPALLNVDWVNFWGLTELDTWWWDYYCLLRVFSSNSTLICSTEKMDGCCPQSVIRRLIGLRRLSNQVLFFHHDVKWAEIGYTCAMLFRA